MTSTDSPADLAAFTGGGGRRVLTITVLTGVQFLAVFDGLAVALALPAIGTDLGLGATGLAWVVNAYTLALVGGLLLAGRLTDVRGHRPVLLAGLLLLTAGSAAAGLLPLAPALLAARVLQGCGAALCYPSAMALVGTLFPFEPWRSRAFAASAGAAATGAGAGAVFGGAVTGLLGWPWVFLLTVPVGGALLVGARVLLPGPAPRQRRPLDLPGAALGAAAAVSAVLALSRLEHPDPTDLLLVAAATATPVLGLGWWAWERRQRDPLVPAALLRSRALLGGCAGIAANSALYSATVFVGSLHLQRELGLGPVAAGVAFLPLSAVSVVAGLGVVTPVRRRFGSTTTGVAGLALGALCLLLLAVTPPAAGVAPFLLAQVAIGLALTCAFTSFTADTITASAAAVRGTSAGVFETATHLAGAMSIAAFASTIALTGAYSAAYVTGAGLVGVGAVTAALVLRGRPETTA